MRASGQGGAFFLVLGSFFVATLPPSPALARSHTHTGIRHAYHRLARATRGLQCVPFARNASGVDLIGNAVTWWNQAAGVYERGSEPEPGSVLAFRANGWMRLGHVAVVSRVVNAREIEIDHANWGSKGAITRNTAVVDVSPRNDWTAVRVGLRQTSNFGSIYPTYGFIYARPDEGTMVAAKDHAAPEPKLNPAPRDLRPASERGEDYEEVAEAPAPRHHGRHHRR
ncbi:MAG: CHAP domain-containing protein [Acetobacteraceae bacterium]|nr:CHAP domain-containing protein [Acetobacteraceae bacterium]